MAGRSRRRRSARELKQARQRRQEKLAVLHDTLRVQVDRLTSGAQWQQWLRFAARFHHYSFGNILLILAQRPEATLVAGYTDWPALGRHVREGEKGIQILAPIKRGAGGRPTGEAEPDDEPVADPPARGTPASRREIVGMTVAHVFDVSQTDGDPLPEQPRPRLLSGQAPAGLWTALAGLTTIRGYTVERGDCGGANGRTFFDTRTVRIRADVDDAQAVKTLAHELGHVLLHDNGSHLLVCRGAVEVEAESVAYLVAAGHGLDTADYTFPYVARWAHRTGEDPGKLVRATGQRVIVAAHQILDYTTSVLADQPTPSPGPAVAQAPPAATDNQTATNAAQPAVDIPPSAVGHRRPVPRPHPSTGTVSGVTSQPKPPPVSHPAPRHHRRGR